ncbi:polar amino acid ABC transporter permease [Leuconostoc litchii]|uniref:Amino acid ABC transporter permease n=1 Tax=Leuconostoc litchii TaxID=1981069 RepID=A0A6P2CMI5_9LACO|nr:amino acid ABC transporter permease [Leuconostoc litchii]TYC46096.1 amino acid ABC transporter permease [Leuconostoc litchii]GMA69820.1 polar amino acid ABC transporter permease [Leuconostoc litchii]
MSWAYIQQAMPDYIKAFWLRLKLSTIGIAGAVLVGIVAAFIIYYKIPGHRIILSYIEIARNTPLLIQLFFIYYGLPITGIKIPAQQTAIIGLVFLGGAYMSDAFLGGLRAVPKIQIESGRAIGLSTFQLSRFVVFPQGFIFSLPALAANVIFLIKETSIFTVIAIPEITNTTLDLIGQNYRTNEYLLMMVSSYAVILIPLSVFLSWIERRIRYANFGN